MAVAVSTRTFGAALPFVAAMAIVVLASNILVQFPVNARIGALNLADLLTYGAFTYPVAFLVTDLTNRRFGPGPARFVVTAGFVAAILLSLWFATPRIAIASGAAFLVAQLLDVSIFDRLRRRAWWVAPLTSSSIGSAVDTTIFFTLAFAAGFSGLGANDPFATEVAPFLGVLTVETARWMSWAAGDFAVKLLVAAVLLVPFGLVSRRMPDVHVKPA